MKHVNILMKLKWENYIIIKSRHGLRLPALQWDERSQDVILNLGIPIISKVNIEGEELFKNQRFEVIKITDYKFK